MTTEFNDGGDKVRLFVYNSEMNTYYLNDPAPSSKPPTFIQGVPNLGAFLLQGEGSRILLCY